MNYNKNTYMEDGSVWIHIMSEDCRSFLDLSFYSKEKHIMWVSNLNVERYARKQGRGNLILKYAFKLAKKLGCKYIYLEVKKGTFMFDWYSRLGFEPFSDENNNIQMFKNL